MASVIARPIAADCLRERWLAFTRAKVFQFDSLATIDILPRMTRISTDRKRPRLSDPCLSVYSVAALPAGKLGGERVTVTSSRVILNVTLENPNRARDHLANERTFLAWLRTGMSAVIFGFAIGRFGLALRQLGEIEGGRFPLSTGLSVYVGMASILAGVVMVFAMLR